MNSEHGAGANTDLEELPEPREDTLLKIGKVVPIAERFNLGLDLLIFRHGQVGNQMVLDLVVEPHLGVVDPVVSGVVIHRSQHLIHVKLLLVLVVVAEAKQVASGGSGFRMGNPFGITFWMFDTFRGVFLSPPFRTRVAPILMPRE